MKQGFLILLTIAFAFCSCKTDEIKEQELIDDFVAESEYNFTEADSGLLYEILEPGTGDHPLETESVTVHYTGTLLDGTLFDTSYDGNPPTFSLGGGVIEGWTKGVPLLKRGGKGIFLIPSDLAYGQLGSPPSIPANAPLLFEIELIDF